MQDAKGGFVSGQSELALKLDSGHPLGLAGEKIGGPEPGAQWHMAALHHRANRQASVLAAGATPQNAWAGGNPKWFSDSAAARTNKPVSPARCFQIDSASCIIRKQLLEFRQRLWERQIGASDDVHDHMPRIAPLSSQTHGVIPHLEQTLSRTNLGFNSRP